MTDTCQIIRGRQIDYDFRIRMILEVRRGNSVTHFAFHRFGDDLRLIFTHAIRITLRAFIMVAIPIVMTPQAHCPMTGTYGKLPYGQFLQQNQTGTRTQRRTYTVKHNVARMSHA